MRRLKCLRLTKFIVLKLISLFYSRNSGKYIWERPSYAKAAADKFIKEHCLPFNCLQIIEYDMIEVGPIEYESKYKDADYYNDKPTPHNLPRKINKVAIGI